MSLGCADDQGSEPDRCCANLRFYHAAPSYADADVFADYYNEEQKIVSNLAYGETFPAHQYLSVETTDVPDEFGIGTYNARLVANLRDEFSETDDANGAEIERAFAFDRFENYSVWFADSGAGKPYWWVTRDSFDLAVQDTATVFLRFVNLNAPGPVKLVARNTRFSAPPGERLIGAPGATEIYGFRAGPNVFEVIEGLGQSARVLDTLAVTLKDSTDYYFYYDGAELRSVVNR